MTQKILLIGMNGQVGQELKQTLLALGEVIGVGRAEMNLESTELIRQVIREIQPNFIVNAAAYTSVDKAEKEREIAYKINSIAPTIMAEEAQKMGTFLLHISTDYVFDGTKNTPYMEKDQTNPLSIYGQSKLLGEQGIQNHCESYLILRTAWVYGVYGKANFVKTMLRLGQEREEISVVVDQIGNPTWSQDIAQAIQKLLLTIEPENLKEIYHFADSGVASWYDFSVAIFEEAKQLGFPLKVQRVIPITTKEYPTPAKRPAYSVLATQKISPRLGNYPPHWRESLRKMIEQVKN